MGERLAAVSEGTCAFVGDADTRARRRVGWVGGHNGQCGAIFMCNDEAGFLCIGSQQWDGSGREGPSLGAERPRIWCGRR